MASLQQRSGWFHLHFRYEGRQYMLFHGKPRPSKKSPPRTFHIDSFPASVICERFNHRKKIDYH